MATFLAGPYNSGTTSPAAVTVNAESDKTINLTLGEGQLIVDRIA